MGQHGKYTNSIQVAADMDAIRKDLGQATLNFWGLSYGGVLGHTYAVSFPDKVGRVILDGSTTGTGSDVVRLSDTHNGLIGRLDVWTKGIIPALGSPLKWHDLANRLARLMRGDPEEAYLAYGTYHEPPSDDLEMNDCYDLLVLNDVTNGDLIREDRNAYSRPSEFFTRIVDIFPNYLVEFERLSQVLHWRNVFASMVIREDRIIVEKPGNPIMYISAGEPYVGGHHVWTALFGLDNNEWLVIADHGGHTSISMPSKCVALAIREFLDGRPLTSRIDPGWETHACRVDGPEFVHPDELEANAREIVGGNEEDIRLFLAQVALARDTNWRII